jgi:arylsulfatase A-like enzyme
MPLRPSIRPFRGGVFALIAAALAGALGAAERKPNVLFIVADDMGYADLGVIGCQDIPTPQLDALAASGVRLTDAYVTAPYCAPSRAAMLAGRAGTRFGFEFNAGKVTRPGVSVGLPPGARTLAGRLQEAGYRCGLVGKWHLGAGTGQHPLDQGFAEFFGFLGGGSTYFGTDGNPVMLMRGRERVPEREYLTDAFGREAAAFIQRQGKADAPWFLYLAFNAVHAPMQPKPTDLPRAPLASGKLRLPYAGMTIALDDAVGRVMQTLRDGGMDKNTLVVFLSDNGGPTAPINSNVNGSRNDPYRGGKRQLSEGGIRTPMFASWPGVIPAGSRCVEPLSTLDLTPTFLAAAGAAADDASLEGVNLLPLWRGDVKTLPPRALAWRFGWQFAIREGDWKLVRWKHDDGKGFTDGLFNLRDDPGESHDLRSAQPKRAKALAAAWLKWNTANVAPLWGTADELEEATRLAAQPLEARP